MDATGVEDDDEFIPVKDLNDASAESDLARQMEAEHVFNQQRAVVAKLTRDELEDRYLRLLEENVVLKKHACKQEDKIKKLATKLIRVLSEKKRLEMSSGGVPARHRDIETEELIEDQQHKIRELERQAAGLKEKLAVAKQQLIGVGGRGGTTSGFGGQRKTHAKQVSSTTRQGHGHGHYPLPSPGSVGAVGAPAPLLTQQAHRLLEEARNENRMLEENERTLREQINIFEQELEQQRERHKIKESNFEEEIQILKAQVLDGQRHTATENIQLIQLHKDNNLKGSQLQTVKAQLEGMEEELTKCKADRDSVTREAKDLGAQLQEEQQKNIAMSKKLSENVSCRETLLELEEKCKDLQKENTLLRESNDKLLDSAYNLERERQHQASENALKVQIAQLETTLKADLQDKQVLQNALIKEREQYSKLEADFQDIQSKYFSIQESVENQEQKLKYFASENSITTSELEEALVLLRLKKDSSGKDGIPSFLAADDNTDDQGEKNLKSELSELQVHYVETVNELEKTRSLLRVQGDINAELKSEVAALQSRLQQMKIEYHGQMSEYKKLLDLRASRIQKLEVQLRETAYGNLQRNIGKSGTDSGVMIGKETSVQTSRGQTLFEMHMQKVSFTQESLVQIGMTEPKIFATWTFYDHDIQYTPMALGPEAIFDSSSYYKIKLDDSLLDYFASNDVQVDLHLVTGNDCKNLANASVKLNELLHYPANKLHGSVMLHWNKGKQGVLGTLDYWFKLHTADIQLIQQWLDRKAEVARMLAKEEKKSQELLREIQLLPRETEKLQMRNETMQKKQILSQSREEEDKPKIELTAPSLKVSPARNNEDLEIEKPPAIKVERSPPNANPRRTMNPNQGTTNQKPREDELIFGPKLMKNSPKSLSVVIDESSSTESDTSSSVAVSVPAAAVRKVPVIRKPDISEFSSSEENSLQKPAANSPVKSPSNSSDENNSVSSEANDESRDDAVLEKDADKKTTKDIKQQEDNDEKSKEDVAKPDNGKSKKSGKKGFLTRLTSKLGLKDNHQKSVQEDEAHQDEEEPTKKPVAKPRKVPLSNKDHEEKTKSRAIEIDEDSSSEEEEEEDTDDDDDGDVEEVSSSAANSNYIQHSSTGGESISQDSEGLVLSKQSPAAKRESVTESDAMIVISISTFKATNSKASFLHNDKIKKLYVEYKFLDLPADETETPISLPKPKPGESISFNYRKMVPMETAGRRRLLMKMLQSEDETLESSVLTFTVISEPEPDESEDDQDNVSSNCEELGRAAIDLREITRKQQDLEDYDADVLSVENNEVIGTLTISILANKVIKSLKIL